ncbi:AraC family transcriptional regulator [Permianibacter aggregans]|uniref:AraC family transcriptional regulator n=1 Tax=Permianibacter aggregans TaxID=1510150 RepID=A0A4R6UXS9_9GAMM|nr:AraC family transcriptional regulator [Permianibacter aggregans]TDQ50385.1 AraC family transcriptional regulator [Permianibacter aggregans]
MSGRVAWKYASAALECAESFGIEHAKLINAASLRLAQMDDEGEISVVQYRKLLQTAVQLSGDMRFGLQLGQTFTLGHYAHYGLLLMSSRHLGDAMHQVMRFESLAHELGHSSLIVDGERARYVWARSEFVADVDPILSESVFAGIAHFVRWLLQAEVTADQISFEHAAINAESDYQQVFNCPVQFNAGENSIHFAAKLLLQPIRHADPQWQAVLVEQAERRLQERAQQHHYSAQVMHHLEDMLALGHAELEHVAQKMCVSERSLQRHLQSENTSFQRVLEETRKRLAQRWLKETKLPLTEIAFLLAYQEQSSFTNAFKNWFGMTPSQWRKQQ